MNDAVKFLRSYFKSEEWLKACRDTQQPVVSDGGIVGDEVKLDTKINLALEFECKFNEFARAYMQYRKDNNMQEPEIVEMSAGLSSKGGITM